MIVYHGTPNNFEMFDKEKIYSGEGIAKRGYGFNFSIDKDVAKHYFESSGKDNGYLIKASVPDKEYLLNLDNTIDDCLQNKSLYEVAIELGEYMDVDIETCFEEAQENEGVSMSYPDDRAEEMFERFVTDLTDHEALEELTEWSPNYDWKTFKRVLDKSIGFEFDKNFSTGESLYEHLSQTLGGTEKAAEFLESIYIKGTYGKEVLSNESDAVSVVVFNDSDIAITDKEELKSSFSKKQRSRIRP